MIKEAIVTIMIIDMDRSIEFYTKLLGFKLINRAGDEWVEIQAPGLVIGLHKKDGHSSHVKVGDNMSIGFSVDDIKKVIKHFEGKGLKIQPYEAEAVSLGFFKDLDDNQLYFVEEKK